MSDAKRLVVIGSNSFSGASFVSHCLREGKLITMTAGSAGTTMRFMPPLTVSQEEIDLALAALDKALVDAV